jgi:nicotinamidase-related amidase
LEGAPDRFGLRPSLRAAALGGRNANSLRSASGPDLKQRFSKSPPRPAALRGKFCIEITRLDGFLKQESYCVPGTKGCDVVEDLSPKAGEYRIVKNRFSGFMNTELDFILRRLYVCNIVVCGIQYPNCIRATIFDGVLLGYNVTLVTDAAGAQTEEVAKANIYDISNIGVTCVTVNQFLNNK